MNYTYRPFRFYGIAFVFTWLFWVAAAVVVRRGAGGDVGMLLMLLGLFVPSVTALCMVLRSGSPALKRDLRQKFFGLFRVRPPVVFLAIATKCVETVVLFLVAGGVVALNRDLFFEKLHVGKLLPLDEAWGEL